LIKNSLAKQGLRFGIIGICSAVTHISIYLVLGRPDALNPLIANLIGFIFAFVVSFTGHRYWTFNTQTTNSGIHWFQYMPRFITTTLLGLGLNTLIVYLIVFKLGMAYGYAVPFMLTIVPVVTFILNKLWVFRAKNQANAK